MWYKCNIFHLRYKDKITYFTHIVTYFYKLIAWRSLYLQLLTLGDSKSVEEISGIYVSDVNGYFIGDDVKNALEVTNDFVAKEFNTTQVVSFVHVFKMFLFWVVFIFFAM